MNVFFELSGWLLPPNTYALYHNRDGKQAARKQQLRKNKTQGRKQIRGREQENSKLQMFLLCSVACIYTNTQQFDIFNQKIFFLLKVNIYPENQNIHIKLSDIYFNFKFLKKVQTSQYLKAYICEFCWTWLKHNANEIHDNFTFLFNTQTHPTK